MRNLRRKSVLNKGPGNNVMDNCFTWQVFIAGSPCLNLSATAFGIIW